MIIGVVKEIKDNEYRVGMVPAGVKALTESGHQVLVQEGAGEGSGIGNEEYRHAGATLIPRQEVWGRAEMVAVRGGRHEGCAGAGGWHGMSKRGWA